MNIDPHAAKEAARRLVTRAVFHAIQCGATEAKVVFDSQRITVCYLLDGEWQPQEDMPAVFWPQILRHVRNSAFLTLGTQPPRQEGTVNLCVMNRAPDGSGEERDYTLQLVITHSQQGDEIHWIIGKPIIRPCKPSHGYEFIQSEKI